MRNYRKLSCIAFAAIIMAFPSCNKPTVNDDPQKLSAPELLLKESDDSSFTVEWSPVDGASSYEYKVNDNGDNVVEPSITVTGLTAGETYVVKVRAMPEDPEVNTPSDWASLDVTLSGNDDGKHFEINASLVGDLLLSVSVVPDDDQQPFYREAMSEATFLSWGGTAEEAWEGALAYYINLFGDAAFDMISSLGPEEYEVPCPRYEDNIHFMVAYVDRDLNRLSEVEEFSVYTGDAPQSDNTFDISFHDITASSAIAEITPSNNDPYTVILMESEDIAGMEDDDLRDFILSYYEDYINDGRVYSGEMSMTYREGSLKPARSHTMLAFGWNTVPNTPIYKYEFTTEEANSGENLTFEMFAEAVGPTEIHVTITPSDLNTSYFAFVMTPEELDKYREYPPQYILDVCDQFGIGVDMYMEMFGIVGSLDKVWNDFDNGIMPDTEYTLWAVGLTINGEDVTFHETQFYDEPIITPAM